MLRKLTTISVALLLGGGAALGIAACGEKRGSLQIKGDTGTGTGSSTTGTGTTSKTTTSP